MLTAGLLTDPIPIDPTGLLNTREMAGGGALRALDGRDPTPVGATAGALLIAGSDTVAGAGGANNRGNGFGFSGLTQSAANIVGEYIYFRNPTLAGVTKYLVPKGRTGVTGTTIFNNLHTKFSVGSCPRVTIS